VVQRNLVFVVGLSSRLADPEVLKKPEYFGRFGRIHKVVINTSTTYAGNQNQVLQLALLAYNFNFDKFLCSQGPSASAYVTYYKSEDALRAIQAVNNIIADGRTLKASLGTTKYCSHFMKNMTCPKHDCMYLHELGKHIALITKLKGHYFDDVLILQETKPLALRKRKCNRESIQNTRRTYMTNLC
jgi:CCR4-NOT transcription complex subunit 4